MSRAPDAGPPTTLLWRVGRSICWIFTAVFFKLKLYGKENVPLTGGVLLVSNHQSFLDPILVAVRLKRPVSFFARASLFENRYFGWLIRSLQAFPVRRGQADVGAMKEAIKRLEEGYALNIFPEGTRSEDGTLGPIRPGVALIIQRGSVPVIPVFVRGAWQAWPKGRKFPALFRTIQVMYGPPLNVEGLDDRQIIELIDDTFHRMQAELESKP